MHLVAKAMVQILFVAVLSMLVSTARYGRREAHRKVITKHVQHAGWSVWVTLFAVGAIELLIRLSHPSVMSRLFAVHLGFAVPFFVTLLVLRFYLTGLRNGSLHRVFAYSCLVAYSGALITGSMLLWRS